MSEMFKISFPTDRCARCPQGSTPADVAAAIGPGLAKAALAARVDGEVRDLNRPFEGDAEPRADHRRATRRTRSSWSATISPMSSPRRCRSCFPGTQITFGPATDDGFYYDFAPAPDRGPFTDEDLPAIEEEMRRIIAADEPLVREVWSREDVRALFERAGRELQGRMGDGAARGRGDHHLPLGQGEDAWLDLCRGPHLPRPASSTRRRSS